VKIYEFVSGAWTQKGSTLNGTTNSLFGISVSLSSDGLILAVGASGATSGSRGYVNIYEFVSGAWTQKGSRLNGNVFSAGGSQFGISVSLSSNGLILAVGAPTDIISTNFPTGSVNIYEFVGGAWTRKGSTLSAASLSYFGRSVSLSSDGLILAVGAPLSMINFIQDVGSVITYEFFNGAWTQIGSQTYGQGSSAYYGFSVSLSSSGVVVAIGAPLADTNKGYIVIVENRYPRHPVIGQIFFSSDVNKLYIWNGSSWKSVVFT